MTFIDIYNQEKSNMYLFGELHGTNEMPRVFISAIKEVMTLNKHINIFLEINYKLQKLLNDYINDKICYKSFLKEKMYNEEYDGRGTKAFFEIIQFAKNNKNQISLYFVDKYEERTPNPLADCEVCTKELVCKYYNNDAINFFYAGSAHTATNKVLDSNLWKICKKEDYLPCGYLIKQEIPTAVSIKLNCISGKVICLHCTTLENINDKKVSYSKIKNFTQTVKSYNKFIKIENDLYDYYYNIKRVTPSYKLR